MNVDSMKIGDRLEAATRALPRAYAGPGGAVAVLRGGEVLVRHAWGWANAERRIPFTPRTLARLCSITKQFTCATLLDAFPDPSALDEDVRARLPHLQQAAPGARHLCHNQSGLRDYWAVAMLHGSPAEAPFGDREAARVIGGTRTLQFAPGTRYSYCNQNFRILSDILQDRTGQDFADLLRSRVFDRAGMQSALLAADTRAMPDGAEGYEGTPASGFRAAENRIVWTGDAGLGASLDDMIAWERHIDRTRDDPDSLYGRLCAPVAFADGAPAAYGFGLGRHTVHGRSATGHGGALRGWRCHRMYVAAERVSVVVLFNHMADARMAAMDLLAAALGEETADSGEVPPDARLDRGLCRAGDRPRRAHRPARAGPRPAAVRPPPRGADAAPGRVGEQRRRDVAAGGGRIGDGARGRALVEPIAAARRQGVARFRRILPNAELDAELRIADAGGVPYGGFAGFLGAGRMELLDPIGPDLWALPCLRALDHTPPGDWTLAVRRDDRDRPVAVEVGCWLARGLLYERDG